MCSTEHRDRTSARPRERRVLPLELCPLIAPIAGRVGPASATTRWANSRKIDDLPVGCYQILTRWSSSSQRASDSSTSKAA